MRRFWKNFPWFSKPASSPGAPCLRTFARATEPPRFPKSRAAAKEGKIFDDFNHVLPDRL